jgi:hypothetical protein
MFGHGETKKTGLKLHNLPELKPTNIVPGREQRIWKMPPSPDRKRLRSTTFLGIGLAFAAQWGTERAASMPQENDRLNTMGVEYQSVVIGSPYHITIIGERGEG